MIVFNLQCERGHAFEGWFASATAFEAQQQRGLVGCAVCDSKRIERLLSAPRINLGAPAPRAESPPPIPPSSPAGKSAPTAAMQVMAGNAALLQALRTLLERTEDVGSGFTEEARRMHYGEIEARAIRGVASAEDAQSLREEGIDILALPVPEGFGGPSH